MTLSRKEWVGNATATTLSGGITAGSPAAGGTFSITSGTNYPTGAFAGGFVLVIDVGTAQEEKILCSARSGTTVTVATSGRGWDGTTAQSHGGGVTLGTVNHCVDADTLTDVSAHIYDTTRNDHTQYMLKSLGTTQGDLIGWTAASTPARIAKGTGLQYLRMNAGATTQEYATLPTVPTTVTFYSVHTWAIGGPISVPSGDIDFINPMYASKPGSEVVTLLGSRYKINSGTSVTLSIQLNGSNVAALTNLSVTSTVGATASSVVLADGDKLAPVVSAVSGSPKNLSVNVILQHAVTLA